MGLTHQYEEIPCNLCGGTDIKIKFMPFKKEFNPEEVFSASRGVMGTQQIVQCRQCGLIYVNPRLKGTQVVEAYEKSEDDLYVSQEKPRLQTFKAALKLLERYRPKKGKVLDVGAAAGFFLKVAKDAGWETYGVEPSRWLAQWGNERYGVNIRAGVLQEARFSPDFFDAVTMWDVLEHTPDPMKELAEAQRVLKKGGILVINYPNIGSWLARGAGKRWWFLLSVHLYYFTHATLRRYLEANGFEVLKISRYFQKLELEHLVKMVGLYHQPLSRLGLSVVRSLRLNRVQIPYYASQANVVARKK